MSLIARNTHRNTRRITNTYDRISLTYAVSHAPLHAHAAHMTPRTHATQTHTAPGVAEAAKKSQRDRQQPTRLPCRHEKLAWPRQSQRPFWRRAGHLGARGGRLRFGHVLNGLAPSCTCERGRARSWLFYLLLANGLPGEVRPERVRQHM